MAEIDRLLFRIEADTALLRGELSRAQATTEAAARRMESAFGQANKSLGVLENAAKTAGAAIAALGVGNIVRNIVTTNAEFQRLSASLKTVTGSAEAGQAAMREIERFARETPFQLNQVVQAFVKLKGLGLDPSMEALRSYGNTASALGRDLNQMIEAVADAATGEFERLKEFGIRASKEGEKVSLTFKGVTTTVANNAAAITGYLRRIGEVDFSGAMAAQMETLGGAFSNLQDTAEAFARKIGEAGLNDAVLRFATQLTDAAGGADRLATALGVGLGAAVDGLAGGFKVLADNADLAVAALAAIGSTAAIATLRSLLGTVTAVGGALAGFAAAHPIIAGIAVATGAATLAVRTYGDAVVDVGAGATVWDYTRTAIDSVADTLSALAADAREVAGRIGGVFAEAFQDLGRVAGEGVVVALKALDTLATTFVGVFRGLANVVATFGGIFTGAFDDMTSRAGAKIVGMGEAMSLALSGQFAAAWDRLDQAMRDAPIESLGEIPGRVAQAFADGFGSADAQQPILNAANDLVGQLNSVFDRWSEAAGRRAAERLTQAYQDALNAFYSSPAAVAPSPTAAPAAGAGKAGQKVLDDLKFEVSLIGQGNLAREIAIKLRAAETTVVTALGREIAALVTRLEQEKAAQALAAMQMERATQAAADHEETLRKQKAASEQLVQAMQRIGQEYDREIADNATLLGALRVSNREYEVQKVLLEILAAYRRNGTPLIGDEIDAQRQLAETLVDQRQAIEDVNREVEASREVWRNALEGIQRTGADVFEDIFSGAVDSSEKALDAIKTLAIRTFAEIAAAATIRPTVQFGLEALGASPDFLRSAGFSPSSALSGVGGSGGGGVLSGVQDFLGIGNLLGDAGGLLGLPTLGNAFSFLTGTGAFASSFVGPPTAAVAATSAAGIGASVASLAAPFAAIAVPLLIGGLSSLFEDKDYPYTHAVARGGRLVEGELFSLDGGDVGAARKMGEALESGIQDLARVLGLGADALSALPMVSVGFNTAGRGGNLPAGFFSTVGDGGFASATGKGFDSAEAAVADGIIRAFLTADWESVGAAISPNLRLALEKATGDTAAELAQSVSDNLATIETFDAMLARATDGLDPLARALQGAGEQGAAAATAILQNAEAFRDRAQALGLGTDVLANGLSGADAAMRGYIDSLLAAEDAVDPLTQAQRDLAAAQSNAAGFAATLSQGLIDLGYSADQAATMAATASDRLVAAAQANLRAVEQALTAAQVNIQTAIQQAINPAYQMSAVDLFRQQGLDWQTTGTHGGYGRLFGLVSGAASGDAAALQQVGERLIANQAFLSQSQIDAILGYATAAFGRATAASTGGFDQGSNGGATSSSGGGVGGSSGGGAANDNGARDALRGQIEALRDHERALQDVIREEERLADLYGGLGDRLRAFRESLLVSDLSPLTPEQQLAEARRQFEDTLARAQSGDADAIEDLEGVSRTLLEKSRAFWASSTEYQADFDRVQTALLSVEAKARDIAAESLSELQSANQNLLNIQGQIAGLEDAIGNIGSGGSSGGGSTGGGVGGGGSSGGTSGPPPAGYYVENGQLVQIRFGLQNLGRTSNESAASFLGRRFQNYTGARTEDAGFAWMQQIHGSGLGLTNNSYYAAASIAGYGGGFGSSGHTNWLNADGSGDRWRAFITELRGRTHVPVDHFRAFGAPAGFAAGGLVTGGMVTGGIPGRDSVHAMLMPGEFVMPAHRVSAIGVARLEAMRVGARSNDDSQVIAELRRAVDRLEAIVARQDAQIRQYAAGTHALADAVDANTQATRRNRPRQVDPGQKKSIAA